MLRFEKSKKSKAIIVVGIAILVVFFGINQVLAQSDPALTQVATQVGFGQTPLLDVIYNVIRVALGLIGLIGVSLVIYGGFLFMSAGSDTAKVEKGRKLLINAAIGVAIILASYAIVSFVFGLFGINGNAGVGTGPAFGGGGYEGGTGALGGGIIQSHYPARGALEVPRNTSILITFKEKVDVSQIINNGKLTNDVFAIFPSDTPNDQLTNVNASTSDDKTFIFKPVTALGSPDANINYTVGISGDLRKADGSSAFGNLAASGDFAYQWSFQTSTNLDLDPPYITSVIPRFSNSTETSVARNVIVQINFSEPVNPITISGVVQGGAGDYDIIQVKDDTTVLNGVYDFGNNYQTVEFVTNESCGINSCGNEIFCLPASKNIDVKVKSASLLDPTTETPFQAKIIAGNFDGIVDLADNALDGNNDKKADGNSGFYNLNDTTNKQGDNYEWSFYTNNRIKIAAPEITDYSPLAGQEAVDPTQQLVANFSQQLSKTTVKPDSNYGDGFCECQSDLDCNTGETCSPVNGYCVSGEKSERVACYTYLPDTCNLFREPDRNVKVDINDVCKQAESVTVNQDKALVGKNANDATWYSPSTVDYIDVNPNRSYSSVITKHGKFLDEEPYGVSYGSSIKDIYQNCYTPNSAPGCERVTLGDGTYSDRGTCDVGSQYDNNRNGCEKNGGTFTRTSGWSGTFPSCDLRGEDLKVKGAFNVSYENSLGQNKVLPMQVLSWDKSSADIFTSNGELSDRFNFFANLTDPNTVNIAFYHDQTVDTGANPDAYYMIMTSNYVPVKTTLAKAINKSSDTIQLASVSGLPIPSTGQTESVMIGVDEITYTSIDKQNNKLNGIAGITKDHAVGDEVIYKSAGNIKFDYGITNIGTSDATTLFNAINTANGSGSYTATLKWNTDNELNSIIINEISLDNELLEFDITPQTPIDVEYLDRMKLRIIYPGGILELPKDKQFKIIQTSL